MKKESIDEQPKEDLSGGADEPLLHARKSLGPAHGQQEHQGDHHEAEDQHHASEAVAEVENRGQWQFRNLKERR